MSYELFVIICNRIVCNRIEKSLKRKLISVKIPIFIYSPIPPGHLFLIGGMCERVGRVDLRHLTGQGGSTGLACRIKGSVQCDGFSWRYDLEKQNLKCHLNYSNIFTELSFS